MTFPAYSGSRIAGSMDRTTSANSRVILSETILFGRKNWRIETEACVWHFDPAGGAFSRLSDRDGLDWIGFEPGPPPRSYRGIPNIQTFVAGKFSGIFHPGYTSVHSAILEAGPECVVVESTSGDIDETAKGEGVWVCRWAIYPDRAVCTVLRGLPGGFAFLYEGTPGGGPFDGAKDYMRLPTGKKQYFSNGANEKRFIPPGEAPESVRFGRDGVGRELEFSFASGDGSRAGIGQYSVYESLTVFGFGREEEPGIRGYPATFTLRFVETGSSGEIGEVHGGDTSLAGGEESRCLGAPRAGISCSLDGIDNIRIAGRPSAFFSVPGRVARCGVSTVGREENLATAERAFACLAPSEGLAWSLNRSPPRRLALGPDGGRLAGTGDFVADIPWCELRPGANELSFLAIVGDAAGVRPGPKAEAPSASTGEFPCESPGESAAGYSIDVSGDISPPAQRGRPLATYSFIAGLEPFPELPAMYDFESSPRKPTLIALPVDGQWLRDSGGISLVRMGYDRLLAFGDLSLRDYRLRAEITPRGFAVDAPGYPDSMGPGVGFLLRWTGHHPDGLSPFREWRPIGALGWYRYGRDRVDTVRDFRLQLLGGRMKADTFSEAIAEDSSGRKLEMGIRYIFLLEVDGRTEYPARYGLKVWEAGKPEPEGWDLAGAGLPGEARSGSALLVLHYADAILHYASIEPLPAKPGDVPAFLVVDTNTET